MKHLVTITAILILTLFFYGCRHSVERLEPYGWTCISPEFDSLTVLAEGCLFANVQSDSVANLATKMAMIADESDNNANELKARTLYWKAYSNYLNWKPEIASQLLDQADGLTTDLYTRERIDGLKMVYGNYKTYETFKTLLHQLGYFASIGDKPQEGNTAMLLCNSLMFTEAPDLALAYLNKADSLFNEAGTESRLFNLRINKTTLLCMLDKSDEAAEAFEKLFVDTAITENQNLYELLLRNHYYFFGDSASLFKGYEVNKSNVREGIEAHTLDLLYEAIVGEYFLDKGMVDSAANYIVHSPEVIDELYDDDIKASISQIYARYYDSIGDDRRAVEALTKYNALNDSIRAIQQPENKIYTEYLKAKQQIEVETEQDKRGMRMRLYAVVGAVGLLLVVGTILVRRWHRNHKAKVRELSQMARKREREMMAMALSRQQSDRILGYVEDEIARLSREESLTSRDMAQLDTSLRLHMSDREGLQSFEKTFTNINPDFESRLRAVAPELSDNQIRLCSYIMLGLNNQEIASLMNVKASSLRQARLRLRQKFGLTKDDSLSEFLKQIISPDLNI